MIHEDATSAAGLLIKDLGFIRRSIVKDWPGKGRLAGLILLAVATTDLIWGSLAGWTVHTGHTLAQLLPLLAILLPLALIKRYRCDQRIRNTLAAAALFVLFIPASGALSYLVISTNAPLADVYFAQLDKALGFDWGNSVKWLAQHQALRDLLRIAYASGLYQIVVIIPFLGLTGRFQQLYELVLLFMAGALAAIAISGLIPAAGPWLAMGADIPFDASALSHFQPLRDGSLRAIEFGEQLQGLVSMPSYHAMVAMFLVWGVRRTRLFPAVLAINVLMIISTPTEGGHYLVDVIGGGFCAAALIWRHGRFE